jgi:four helix bundle protein
MKMQDFRNLDAWKKAHQLALNVYRETQSLPREETFGLTMQLRRSAVAIATRLAEVWGREGFVDLGVFLQNATVLCNELEYLSLLAVDLKLWKPEIGEDVTAGVIVVRKMIYGLLRKM